MSHRVSLSLGASTLTLETGKIARQADGSVLVQQGGTVVLVTAVYTPSPTSSKIDVVPLTVDYREKTYAAGKIPGGFFKREGRPTEKEILTARLIDRPIRPLFPHGFQHELQVMAIVLSSDGEYDPDVLAVLGGSTALQLSSLPYPKRPLAAVRVGLVNGQWLLNPTYKQLDQSSVDLVLAGTAQGVLSIEAGLKEVPEQQLIEAITFGYDHVLKLIALEEELVRAAGRPKVSESLVGIRRAPAELVAKVREQVGAKIMAAQTKQKKEDRYAARQELLASLLEQLAPAGGTVDPVEVQVAFDAIERDALRHSILETQRRADGRSLTQLREITCEVGVLPRTHGSGLFTRGETQSLSVTTLGTSEDEQLIEALEGESFKRFMLHYNFPPFSVGEVRPVRGPGRREIGHGALAERALTPMIPSKDEFP